MLQFIPLILSQSTKELISNTINLAGDLETSARLDHLQDSVDTITAGIAHQSTMLSAIQSSIGAIGMTSAVGCALSAVNVFQLVQVQKKLHRMEKRLEDGFIDLKSFFSEKLENLLERQQQQRLAEAYSYYIKGLEQLQAALLIEDKITRNQSLGNCQAMFVKSHSVYDNAYFDQQINLPAHLRRLECSWAISSSMAEVYCLQLEYRAGLHSYQELQRRICRDVETLKTKLNAQNHQFVGADLQWLFENDMKIIAAKIQALDSYQKQRVFPSLSLQPPLMLDEAGLKTLSVGGVNGYIDCLLSEAKTAEVRQVVQQSRYLKDKVSQLPLLQVCHAYDAIQTVMSDTGFEMQLEQWVNEYANWSENGVYCFNNIPPKRLANVHNGYGQGLKSVKPLLLFDNTFFGTTTEGFLLTPHSLGSPRLYQPLRWTDIFSITWQQDSLNINGRFFASLNNYNYPRLRKLFDDIKKMLSQMWQQRGTIWRHQGDWKAAQEAYQKAWQLDSNNLDSLEGLLIVAPSFATLKTYVTELKRINCFFRLTDLKTELVAQQVHNFTALRFPDGDCYVGHCGNNELAMGEGIRVWANGDYYEGEWQGGMRHGQGLFISLSDYCYEGEWQHDLHHGHGVMRWGNGDCYTGDWVANRQQGKGIFTASNGERYEGDWFEGVRHGHGRCTWPDGSCYEGNWEQGARQGQGVMRWKNGDSYEGQWVKNQQVGCGTFTWANGDRYEGEWANEVRQGQGKLTLANGSYYKGEWQNNQKHGRGVMVWKNRENKRDRYEGDWEADQLHGKGTMTWLDGSRYTGNWVKGKRSGQGAFTWATGDSYEGAWLNNLRHGEGRLKWLSSNSNYQGWWVHDQPQLGMMRETKDWV
jgi:hypothetical protein